MELLSVVIITYNEERNIGRCIDSVAAIADEIIVLDSFSTDKTISIAKAKGAKVWQEPFSGYVKQKTRAVQLATNNYVISIDADEVIDEQLSASILDAKKAFKYCAYSMNRCTYHCGKFIRHGTWYPDRKIRLFDKRIAKWGGLDPHDKIIFDRPVAIKHLNGEMLHYSFYTLEDHKTQNKRFSSIAANAKFKAGKTTSLFNVVVNPLWAFVHDYFLRAGFLNGKQGFVIAMNQANYTFLKHRKLYKLQQLGKKKGITPKNEMMTKENIKSTIDKGDFRKVPHRTKTA